MPIASVAQRLIMPDAERRQRLESIVSAIDRLLQEAARLHGSHKPEGWRHTAELAVAVTLPKNAERAERQALDVFRTALTAAAAYVAQEWETHSAADFLAERLDELVALSAVPSNAMGVVRRYHDGLIARAARHCRRCGDSIQGADDLCDPCRQNRTALRLMRDPEMPEPDGARR